MPCDGTAAVEPPYIVDNEASTDALAAQGDSRLRTFRGCLGGRLGGGPRKADSRPVIGRADEFDAGSFESALNFHQSRGATGRHGVSLF